MASKYLLLEKSNNVIFLTSPYHTYRSKLIWKKNYPGINIIIPKMTDTPTKKLQWGTNFSKIKIIFYEYLALIYNKYKGWL